MPIALGFSRELATLSALMCSDHVTLGHVGERYAQIALEAHGYLADIVHKYKQGDLRVTCPSGAILRVEVKTARSGKDGTWQFCMKRHYKGGAVKTDCCECDAVMLLGVTASSRVEFFVLPAASVAYMKIVKISSNLHTSKSKWRIYHQNIGTLNFDQIEGLVRELDTPAQTKPQAYPKLPSQVRL